MKTITPIIISFISLVSINMTATAKSITTDVNAVVPTLISEISVGNGVNDRKVELNWSTFNDENNSHFEVERSFYSNNFNTIAIILDAISTNGNRKSYKMKDKAEDLVGRSIAYYRLKHVDANGKINYSNVVVADLKANKSIPTDESSNKIKKNLAIRFTADENATAVLKMQSLTGQPVISKNVTINKGNNTVFIERFKGLSKGVYVAQVLVKGIVINNQKVIID